MILRMTSIWVKNYLKCCKFPSRFFKLNLQIIIYFKHLIGRYLIESLDSRAILKYSE